MDYLKNSFFIFRKRDKEKIMIKVFMEDFSNETDIWFDKVTAFKGDVGDLNTLIMSIYKKNFVTRKDIESILTALPEDEVFTELKSFISKMLSGGYDSEFKSRSGGKASPSMKGKVSAYSEFVNLLRQALTYNSTDLKEEFTDEPEEDDYVDEEISPQEDDIVWDQDYGTNNGSLSYDGRYVGTFKTEKAVFEYFYSLGDKFNWFPSVWKAQERGMFEPWTEFYTDYEKFKESRDKGGEELKEETIDYGKRFKVWDSFETEYETADRYTILDMETGDVFGSSDDPNSPQGVWSNDDVKSLGWDNVSEFKAHGKEILWNDLPEEVKKAVEDSVSGE